MDDELEYLVNEGIKWIQSQRKTLRPSAAEIPSKFKTFYSRYFSEKVLEIARLSVADVISNPPFFANLPETPIDFRDMDGITYDDTILITEKCFRSDDLAPLIFHELVHVVQYQMFGGEEFIRRYIQGWAENGRDYHAIPMEVEAYKLQSRFEKSEAFLVEKEVES